MGSVNKNIVFKNFIWRLLERCGAQIVSFVVSIVLARILDPEAYGTIALITVFITILNVFIDSGFANALIQKKEADSKDFSTVFYFNVFVCFGLYVILFFSAPLIEAFYKMGKLTSYIRVLGLTLIISGIKNVQQAYVSRTMQFKKFFFSTLGGTVFAAIVGITLAFKGAGVWALVAQQLVNALLDTIILWVTVKWRPTKEFSIARLITMFGFGSKYLASSLLNNLYEQLRQLLIGKQYSTANLAYYNKGWQLPNLAVTNVDTAINSVLLPTLSREQDNPERIKAMAKRTIKVSLYVIAPLMMGLFSVAEPLVRIMLTEKWIECVFYLKVFCIYSMFYPVHTVNLNVITATGRSDIFLKLEVWKKVTGLIILIFSMQFGVKAIACGLLVECILGQIINSWPSKTLIGYSYFEQLKDIFPIIIISIVMGITVSFLKKVLFNDILLVFFQVVLGVLVYVFLSAILRIDSFVYLIGLIRNRGNNRG